MEEYDFAIIYFGMTRSVRQTYQSHIDNVFNVLKNNNLRYKTFMHTWKTINNTQNIWTTIIPQQIDYSEYELLNPDYYKIDCEDEFIESLNMDEFFYKDVFEKYGGECVEGEWVEKLVHNYICMLESQKRGFEMVKNTIQNGSKYKYVMFIRPDVTIHNDLPLNTIIMNSNKIHIPNYNNFAGLNDTFAIMNFYLACIYGKRIDEIAEFRKNNGRIVAEKYCKFIIEKYNMMINEIPFNFTITRP